MSEYMSAFEREIVTEGFMDTLKEKTLKIIEVIRKLIRTCINFLVGLIAKLKKKKVTTATNEEPVPVELVTASGADTYNCSKELYDILADVEFSLNLLVKRPKPDHKVGKGYDDRYAQDNQMIEERMGRCINTIEKLDSLPNKIIDLENAEKIKAKFEAIDVQYTQYARLYQAFAKKNPGASQYMVNTQRCFNQISDVCAKASKINLSLMTPKGD